jgi:hypothetical protein
MRALYVPLLHDTMVPAKGRIGSGTYPERVITSTPCLSENVH